jgi:hypothetical protein
LSGLSRKPPLACSTRRENFFIISVDRIFTILFGSPFTNVFDVIGANAAIACVYPPRTTD